MYCIICGKLCDYDEGGMCQLCALEIIHNNRRVEMISILQDVQEHATLPLWLRERIERLLSG